MLLSPEQQSKIALIRAKAVAGTASLDDYKEFVATIRQGRVASQSTGSAKSRSKKEPVNVQALFDDLDKIS